MPDTPPTNPPRGRRAPWIVPLVAAIAALLVAEAGLRLTAQLSPRVSALLYLPTARTEYDDAETTAELLGRGVLGYQPYGHTPGFVLNSRGFRTHEYATAKEPGTLRVVVLGDSFTFDSSGVPYDAMWHQVARRELERRLRQPVEVISLSAPAVGPRFALRLWQLEGRHLDPDLVVFAFFVGNDFTDEAGTPLRREPAGRLALHSYTWRLLRNFGRLWRQPAPAPSPGAAVAAPPGAPAKGGGGRRGGFELASYPATYDPEAATWPPGIFLDIERGRGQILFVPADDRFPELCAAAAEVVERLARDAQAGGAAFLLMVIPDEAQVDPALARRLTETPGGLSEPLDLDRPQRCLKRQLARRDIAQLDLLPVFRRHHATRDDPSGVGLYRPRDTHWTDRGNELAGRTLAAGLFEQGLIRRDRAQRAPR